MKKIIIVFAIVFLASVCGAYAAPAGSGKGDVQSYTPVVPSVTAIADWVADFTTTYKKHDIYKAVEEVYADGRTSEEVTNQALENVEGLNPQHFVAALFCAGYKPKPIHDAMQNAGISEMIVLAGFKTAKTVCGKELTDVQAYTPVARSGFAGPAGGKVSGKTFGSSADFTGAQ